jgi:hypothetical protein
MAERRLGRARREVERRGYSEMSDGPSPDALLRPRRAPCAGVPLRLQRDGFTGEESAPSGQGYFLDHLELDNDSSPRSRPRCTCSRAIRLRLPLRLALLALGRGVSAERFPETPFASDARPRLFGRIPGRLGSSRARSRAAHSKFPYTRSLATARASARSIPTACSPTTAAGT